MRLAPSAHNMKKLEKEIEYVKSFISFVEKGYGKKVCTHKNKKDLHPDCGNCQSQWALGWLRNHLSLIEWELEEEKNKERTRTDEDTLLKRAGR